MQHQGAKGLMVTEYNKAYWLKIKADPERLAKYKARRARNQKARRQRPKTCLEALLRSQE